MLAELDDPTQATSSQEGESPSAGKKSVQTVTRAKSRALLAMTLTKQGTNRFRTRAF